MLLFYVDDVPTSTNCLKSYVGFNAKRKWCFSDWKLNQCMGPMLLAAALNSHVLFLRELKLLTYSILKFPRSIPVYI